MPTPVYQTIPRPARIVAAAQASLVLNAWSASSIS
jgi:hypothetical protein